jgi:hypothetical protein
MASSWRLLQIFAQKDQAEYEFVAFFDEVNRFLRRHCIDSVVQVRICNWATLGVSYINLGRSYSQNRIKDWIRFRRAVDKEAGQLEGLYAALPSGVSLSLSLQLNRNIFQKYLPLLSFMSLIPRLVSTPVLAT